MRDTFITHVRLEAANALRDAGRFDAAVRVRSDAVDDQYVPGDLFGTGAPVEPIDRLHITANTSQTQAQVGSRRLLCWPSTCCQPADI